ncbi:hypothetical protein C8263_13925 [Deinococcus arcticus]|uniref:Uncharacterized protein n=2 Tax=Deinococcus arcticus TaxID=2136176 RepID=A0A2T3W5L8_9DEIO|nr:hypothetical protein C8263_13925 [Deinococcus arcticus]
MGQLPGWLTTMLGIWATLIAGCMCGYTLIVGTWSLMGVPGSGHLLMGTVLLLFTAATWVLSIATVLPVRWWWRRDPRVLSLTALVAPLSFLITEGLEKEGYAGVAAVQAAITLPGLVVTCWIMLRALRLKRQHESLGPDHEGASPKT